MGVTVGVLVLLMFTIQVLGLFDRIVQRRHGGTAVLDAPSGAVAAPATDGPRDVTPGGEIVAAIGAALALAEEDEARPAGSRSDTPPGTSLNVPAQAGDAWAQAGRRQMMDRRGRPPR